MVFIAAGHGMQMQGGAAISACCRCAHRACPNPPFSRSDNYIQTPGAALLAAALKQNSTLQVRELGVDKRAVGELVGGWLGGCGTAGRRASSSGQCACPTPQDRQSQANCC